MGWKHTERPIDSIKQTKSEENLARRTTFRLIASSQSQYEINTLIWYMWHTSSILLDYWSGFFFSIRSMLIRQKKIIAWSQHDSNEKLIRRTVSNIFREYKQIQSYWLVSKSRNLWLLEMRMSIWLNSIVVMLCGHTLTTTNRSMFALDRLRSPLSAFCQFNMFSRRCRLFKHTSFSNS